MELLFTYTFLKTLWVAPVMLVSYFLLAYGVMTLLKFIAARKKQSKLMEAEAIVLNLESTGHFINQQPEVKIHLQVQPDRGRNFIGELVAVLPHENHLTSGSRIRVKYSGHHVSGLI